MNKRTNTIAIAYKTYVLYTFRPHTCKCWTYAHRPNRHSVMYKLNYNNRLYLFMCIFSFIPHQQQQQQQEYNKKLLLYTFSMYYHEDRATGANDTNHKQQRRQLQLQPQQQHQRCHPRTIHFVLANYNQFYRKRKCFIY